MLESWLPTFCLTWKVKWTPSSRQKTSRFKLSSRPWLQLHSAALCHGPERCHVDDQSDREWRHRRQSPTHTRCRSEEHTSELQSRPHLVCRLLLEKKNKNKQ